MSLESTFAHDVPWTSDVRQLTQWFTSRPYLTGASLSLTSGVEGPSLPTISKYRSVLAELQQQQHGIIIPPLIARLNLLLSVRDVAGGKGIDYRKHLDAFPHMALLPQDEESLVWCLMRHEGPAIVHLNLTDSQVLGRTLKQKDVRARLLAKRKVVVLEIPFEGIKNLPVLCQMVQPRTRSRAVLWSHAAGERRELCRRIAPTGRDRHLLRGVEKAQKQHEESVVTVTTVGMDEWAWSMAEYM